MSNTIKFSIALLVGMISINILYTGMLLNRLGAPYWKMFAPLIGGLLIGAIYYKESDIDE